MRAFYTLLLYLTRLELALAEAAPVRNHANIVRLKADESKWSHELLITELNT